MHPIFRAKPAVWTTNLSQFGGRLQTVNLDGNVYEVKKHKMNGLHMQQFHYPLDRILGDVRSQGPPSYLKPAVASKESGARVKGKGKPTQAKTSKTVDKEATKKNISAILRGGAISPL